MKIPSGIPTVADYQSLIGCNSFKSLEFFSDSFLQQNKETFKEYGRKWPLDPFHTYNRQWEYPYVYQQIREYIQGDGKTLLRVNILDAGSGVTFFPFFLAKQFLHARITCCDYDVAIEKLFDRTKSERDTITFSREDLRAFTFFNNSFHLIYCISVLEHTFDYEKIVYEFHRILAPGGLFVVTFDVSLDDQADIPVEEAVKLLKIINSKFTSVDIFETEKIKMGIYESQIISTNYIKKFDKKLLPWRHPFLSLLKSALIRKNFPRSLMKNLTFYCGTFKK